MLKLATVFVNGGFRSITGYSGFADAVMSVFFFFSFSFDLPPATGHCPKESGRKCDIISRLGPRGCLWAASLLAQIRWADWPV